MVALEASLIESFVLMNRFLQEHQIRYVLIGGLAAGYWGEPRFTADMDFTVVSRDGMKSVTRLFKDGGFTVEPKGEWQTKVFGKGSLKFQADLILAQTDYEDWVVQRAIPIKMFDVLVPICSAEDLIILKLIANRRQDLLDIENVLNNHFAVLDKEYLKKWFSFWELDERYRSEFGKDFRLSH